jgi:16S rRNA G966 N2-methylase RsmD
VTPADWTYAKDGGTNYPVQPGETWQVRDHQVHCSDLMADTTFDQLIRTRKWTIVYADPPWNTGNVNAFRTKAQLDRADHTWLDLYQRIIQLSDGVPCYLEGGVGQERQLWDLLPHPRQGWDITYYRTKPCKLYLTGAADPHDYTALDDEHTPDAVLDGRPSGGIVLDPCCGRGLTLEAAHRHGWTAIGNELNPYRVSVTLTKLARLTDTTPERI